MASASAAFFLAQVCVPSPAALAGLVAPCVVLLAGSSGFVVRAVFELPARAAHFPVAG